MSLPDCARTKQVSKRGENIQLKDHNEDGMLADVILYSKSAKNTPKASAQTTKGFGTQRTTEGKDYIAHNARRCPKSI